MELGNILHFSPSAANRLPFPLDVNSSAKFTGDRMFNRKRIPDQRTIFVSPFDRIKVTAAIIIQAGCVLLARRGQGTHLEGYWEFPGGKIEEGESPQQCLRRELREELEITTEIGPIVAENIHRYGNREIHLLALKASILTGVPKRKVHDRVAFIPLEYLLSMKLAPADVPIAAAIRALYGNEHQMKMV